MRRWTYTSFAAAAALAALASLMLAGQRHSLPPVAPQSVNAAPTGPLAGVVVILDPGHGGADPGTTAGPLSEAALSYRTAAELGASLKAAGAEVKFTVRSRCLDPALAVSEPPLARPTDAVMAATGSPLGLRHSPRPLWQRAAAAQNVWRKRVRSDPHAARDVFFLSLHFDQFHTDTVQGGTVCVDRRCNPIPAFAKVLAEQMAQDNLSRSGDYHGVRGLAGRKLGVLDPKYNPVPEKALLEIATLSNPQNAIEAGDALWRGELVRRITLAITQAHQR